MIKIFKHVVFSLVGYVHLDYRSKICKVCSANTKHVYLVIISICLWVLSKLTSFSVLFCQSQPFLYIVSYLFPSCSWPTEISNIVVDNLLLSIPIFPIISTSITHPISVVSAFTGINFVLNSSRSFPYFPLVYLKHLRFVPYYTSLKLITTLFELQSALATHWNIKYQYFTNILILVNL